MSNGRRFSFHGAKSKTNPNTGGVERSGTPPSGCFESGVRLDPSNLAPASTEPMADLSVVLALGPQPQNYLFDWS